MEDLAFVLIRNDRRLIDHEALLKARGFDHFILVCAYPPQWNLPGRLSDKRKDFFYKSVKRFAKLLGDVPLHLSSDIKGLVEGLSSSYSVTILTEEQGSSEEERELLQLKKPVIKTRANTIFDHPRLYPTFTPFRSKLSSPDLPIEKVVLNPSRSLLIENILVQGEGENPLDRVDYYLNHHLKTYEETRNYLEDDNGSSKLSFYLSGGELSVRWLYHEIEKISPGNWLNVELFWREFFWHHRIDFTLPSKGLKIPDWENKISHPLAKAIYNELIISGYISNRSRQILASYLIYDLGLDWKEGAYFYEKHLLDYDVFINWGNWQYIAGLKFDPRGGRKFNLDLQVEKYDPQGLYMNKWSLGS
jgi:deoxyribodipyrimidine photo-lyase